MLLKFRCRFLCCFGLLFGGTCGLAQDSLLKVYANAGNPKQKIAAGLNLAWEYREKGQPRAGIAILKDLIPLCKRSHDTLLGETYFRLANIYDDLSAFDSAHSFISGAINIHGRFKQEKKLSDDYTLAASIYYNQSLYVQSLENYLRARAIREKLNDLPGLAQLYNNIANIYKDLSNYAMSYRNRQKSAAIYRQLNNKQGMAVLFTNMGYDLVSMQDSTLEHLGFSEKQRIDTATIYYRKALSLFRELDFPQGIGAVYGNMGLLFNRIQRYDTALVCEKASYEIYRQLESKVDMAACLGDLALVYVSMHRYRDALRSGEEAQKLAEETGNRFAMEEIYRLMFVSEKALGNYPKALQYHELWKDISDSLKGEEEHRALNLRALQYEFGKKAAADSVKNAEEKRVKDAEIKAQQLQLEQEETTKYFLMAGVALLVIFGAFMYNRFRVTQRQRNIIAQQKEESERQKGVIEEKQKEILDSIYYARRIQRSLLPNEKVIQRKLNQLKKH